LQPTFGCSRNFSALGCVPGLAAPLAEALGAAGLPA
jgi:hypothetical protein